ncbi:MAG: hypothetical protein WDM84_03215 [Bauldia sp.]
MSSIGIISQTMPVAVIVQVILHIIMGIGIMPPIIGMPWGIMFIIMPPIGIPPIGIAPWGIIAPIMGMFIIGICIWGFIFSPLRLA